MSTGTESPSVIESVLATAEASLAPVIIVFPAIRDQEFRLLTFFIARLCLLAMTDDTGAWVSLFSGGKDSSWALYEGLQAGLNVERLVTVHPNEDSYMYHVPATRLTSLGAKSIGIPQIDIDPGELDAGTAIDSEVQGDSELEPLEQRLKILGNKIDLTGVIAGAVESEYQTSRIRGMCDRLDIELYAPLWQEDPVRMAETMLNAGFDIQIIAVAAQGLDETWLGRTIDRDTLAELQRLNREYGVHVLGEGGEFETLVTDAPHMDRRIEIETETEWDGTRGRIRVSNATLAE